MKANSLNYMIRGTFVEVWFATMDMSSNLLHPGFHPNTTGLNREKQCKLAAVFAQKLHAVNSKGFVEIFLEYFRVCSKIHIPFRDLLSWFNAYSNGYYRARHAAAGFFAKARYNLTRFGRLMFLHGPGTTG